MILEQLTQQRPTVPVQAGLQLLVGQTGGIGATQKAHQTALDQHG